MLSGSSALARSVLKIIERSPTPKPARPLGVRMPTIAINPTALHVDQCPFTRELRSIGLIMSATRTMIAPIIANIQTVYREMAMADLLSS
jgi:hypothetical protein